MEFSIREGCWISNIPERLHSKGQSRRTILASDRVIIRHEPLPDGKGYGFEIPGHRHLEDQSANSQLLNSPEGFYCDVLYDCKEGKHYFGWEVACLDVEDLTTLALPNDNTLVRNSDGSTKAVDIFSFEVVHDPTPCMYPHCQIFALKDGMRVKKIQSGFMKTLIRARFAKLAEINREEMTNVVKREKVSMLFT